MDHPAVPTESRTSFVSSKKLTGDGSQGTVYDHFANPVLITRISCSQTGSCEPNVRKCIYAALYLRKNDKLFSKFQKLFI